MTAALAPQIVLADVTVAYDRQPAVHHLSGAFKPASLTAVVGPNGAGKSTLLKAIVGLLRPAEGRVERHPPGAIAYLPQQAEIERSFPISVIDTVLLGHWRRIGWGGGVDAAMRQSALAAIEAARNLGASRPRILVEIVLPQVTGTMVVGLILSFVTMLSVLSVPIMVSGGSPTMMTVDMAFRINSYSDYGTANALGFISYAITGIAAWVYLRRSVASGGKL